MQREQDIGRPYINLKIFNSFVRIFKEDLEQEELYWHQDEYNRLITVIEGSGWKLQMDNKVPIDLIPNRIYNIPMKQYHRIIKGSNDLIVKIEEYDS